ncbi:uracil-DNA glycosylase [Candidatus Liberibacter sp.]|uniref:uracil-DNA glycosylase n=1 Tax=Candidatus Liberibacter sp. TaxID=34022 RepID=UPI0015F69F6F|nr:uracil-DNA glycosylase [Candidatus Liberibacter sp.]MBA5723920.1 uracil-DNA glycosylase [Candidatus Liberibacter sp.]
MTSVRTLSRQQILTTMLFYADAGVYWLFDPQEEENNKTKSTNIIHKKATPSHFSANLVSVSLEIDHTIVKKSYSIAKNAHSLSELKSAISSFRDDIFQYMESSTICADQEGQKDLMIIGYVPSYDDDIKGQPFSGRIGKMLDKMLESIGITRIHTCISMIVPWHSLGNRKLSATEIEICRTFIMRQIELASPKILLLLGNSATQFFLKNDEKIYANLGKWNELTVKGHTMQTLSTLHPQEILEYPLIKKISWRDLITLKTALES